MVYLTVRNTSGGNHGHQLKDLIGGFTIAKVFNFEYVHTYYPYLEFFAIGFGEKRIDTLHENIDYLRYGGPYWGGINFENAGKVFSSLCNRANDTLITVENALRIFPHQTIKWHKDGLINKDVFDEIYTDLSHKYSTKHASLNPTFEKDCINVVVHIGRGESYDRAKYPDHFASDWNVRYMFDLSYFERIFDQIRKLLKKKYRIHVYTEHLNSEEIIKRFSNVSDITLHIGKNRDEGDFELIRSIFHDFVSSDIFVPCNSSFSVMSSYYRKNKPTIYHPHAHLSDLPETDFFPTNIEGEFDSDRLKRYLTEYR